jgi:hypothetical protein
MLGAPNVRRQRSPAGSKRIVASPKPGFGSPAIGGPPCSVQASSALSASCWRHRERDHAIAD